MELITDDYFYKLVKSNTEWNKYRLRLSCFDISSEIFNINFLLLKKDIPAVYFNVLEQLIIPKNYSLSDSDLKDLKTENLTIDTWNITELGGFQNECILTRNELSRLPYVFKYRHEINNLPCMAFTVESKLDTEFGKELVQIVVNPETYSSREKLICNLCMKDSIFPNNYRTNYRYNLILNIINIKYIKDVSIS